MTPSDQLRQILAAHGVSPDTISLTGPRTLLAEELERWQAEALLDAHAAHEIEVHNLTQQLQWERENACQMEGEAQRARAIARRAREEADDADYRHRQELNKVINPWGPGNR